MATRRAPRLAPVGHSVRPRLAPCLAAPSGHPRLATPSGPRRAPRPAAVESKKKKKKFFFFWMLLPDGKEGKKYFSFRFSIPKIPKIPKFPKFPELRGFRGRSREKKKVFLA
jgi:hypothetical protein